MLPARVFHVAVVELAPILLTQVQDFHEPMPLPCSPQAPEGDGSDLPLDEGPGASEDSSPEEPSRGADEAIRPHPRSSLVRRKCQGRSEDPSADSSCCSHIQRVHSSGYGGSKVSL